jgi:hypothetical protein
MNPRRKSPVLHLVIVSLLIFSGCASYAPALVRLNPSGPNVNKAEKAAVIVYVEEYATREKSEKAFDSDMVKEGILPVLVSVENGGREPLEVKAADIIVREGKPLKMLTPEEAATKAQREPVGRALGWSLIVPIISIPIAVTASAIHTSKVNQQIVRDFEAKGFQDGAVMPNRERSGFVFFELQNGRKDLAGLVLELTARNPVTGDAFKLELPLPEGKLTAPADSSRDGEGSRSTDGD